jgi:hypothetical protein
VKRRPERNAAGSSAAASQRRLPDAADGRLQELKGKKMLRQRMGFAKLRSQFPSMENTK